MNAASRNRMRAILMCHPYPSMLCIPTRIWLLPTVTELDFIQSGSVTERVGQAFEERARDLYEVVVFVGQ